MDRREAVLRELNLYPLWVRRAAAAAEAVDSESAVDTGQTVQPALTASPSGKQAVHVQTESSAPGYERLSDESPGIVEAGLTADLSSSEAVSALTVGDVAWPDLKQRVRDCSACKLRAGCNQTVFGVGEQTADWLFVGEGPGAEEDAQGEPFVGQAGKLLDNMLMAIKLKRGKNVYIGNVVKCRPPGNRAPEPDEIKQCLPYLQRQIELIQPKLIVALGKVAANALLGRDAPLASLRGKVHNYKGIPLIITYHPAYLLRTPSEKAKTWQDLCLAVKIRQERSDSAVVR
ncbi:MAG: uracil-DNA glycosylase [Gallionella sp.]